MKLKRALLLLTLALTLALGLGTSAAASEEPRPPDAEVLRAIEYYQFAMDAQADDILAGRMLRGRYEGLEGFGWAWIHSGEADLMQRRMDAITARMRARRDEVSARQWQAAREQVCEAGVPCPLDQAPAATRDPIAAAADLLVAKAGAHRLLLLGETHGTRECPQLAGLLAERYAQQGPVRVALELSTSIDAALQRYMASNGSLKARKALLADGYWHKPKSESDGRRNFEVVNLLETLRALRVQGNAVSVQAIDIGIDQPVGAEKRDQAMAQFVRTAFTALPANAHLLVFAGNVHAMKARPSFAPPEMQTPMGAHLLDLDPYSVRINAGGGEFWACVDGHCGPQPQPENPVASVESSDPSYDFLVAVPRFSLARLVPESLPAATEED
jgi:hypothetical protein